MQTVLVTGATGFIGGHLIDRLLAGGITVIATSAHEERAREASWFDRVRYLPFDLGKVDAGTDYYRLFGEPDAMIHLAWEGLPNYNADFHLQVNYPRHLLFLENLIRNGLRDLTVTGTCLEYGMQEGCLREDLPALPGNPYAMAKDHLRVSLEESVSSNGVSFKWARLFYLYGPGQASGSLIPQLERALLNGDAYFNMSGGEQVRDYLPVGELAGYLADIALQQRVTGIINCCSGKGIRVRDLVNEYLKARGRSIELRYGVYPYPDYEPMRFWGDNTRLKTVLSYIGPK
jgi:nucleoside-diphosphate-sugar epimerase